MRAGQAVRDHIRVMSAPPCSTCGHIEGHFERQSTWSIVDGEVVESRPEDYKPGVFHCSHDGCSCVVTSVDVASS